jgi:hypothetical protein
MSSDIVVICPYVSILGGIVRHTVVPPNKWAAICVMRTMRLPLGCCPATTPNNPENGTTVSVSAAPEVHPDIWLSVPNDSTPAELARLPQVLSA